MIAQAYYDILMSRAAASIFGTISEENGKALTVMFMVFLGVLLTALNVYDEIGSIAGAGTIVPITGFANSITSPAMEYRSEGFILGVGAQMFQVAGPVIVYRNRGVRNRRLYLLSDQIRGERVRMSIKQGKQTYINDRKVYIKETAAIVGPREKAGPLGEYFDEVQQEDYDEKTWEKAEAKFANAAFQKLMRKIDKKSDDIDCILAGDLMNQCIASSLGLRDSGIPYLGLFGACSTIAEGMTTASLLINSGGMSHVICMASSNFCSAEKTFRMPVEQGGQRPPTAQWTVTASGALLISSEPEARSLHR